MTNGISRRIGILRSTTARCARVGIAVAAVASVAACMEGGDGSIFKAKPDSGSEEVTTRRATRLIERDIEAPEVFQVTEAGLWDGRPSLGGVWVAHPDVKEPERVLIRNTSNDKFVIGALFRRERENPGPRIQVSSDAASALGLLAGAPANLNVTALRREEIPTEPVAEAKPEEQALPAAAAVEAKPLDPVAGAAAAIDKAEGKPASAKPAAAATDAPAQPDQVAAAPDAAAEPPKRKGFLGGLFQRKSKAEAPEAVPAAVAAAPTPGAAAPAPGAPASAPQVATAALPTATPASAPAPKPAPKRTAAMAKPYLQIGIFSVEQNARNTATAMRQGGMIPTVREQSSKGKTYWRVLIGPATSAAEQAQLLKKVKAAGFTDAYAVKN